MNNKLYYWAENLEDYSAYNEEDYDQVIEIKRLNFFIGKNNAGKSRFLRKLFQAKKTFKEFQKYDLQIEIDNLIYFLEKNKFHRPTQHGTDNSWRSDGFSPLPHTEKVKIIEDLRYLDSLKFKFEVLKNWFSQILTTLNRYQLDSHTSNSDFRNLLTKIENNILQIESRNCFSDDKLYLPILRGMRPVTEIENKLPYIERAQKDYFQDREKYNSSNIITGECLYHELKIHLLGEPEQRDLIKSYEEKLSQYFFDNDPVSLIPKHDQDVVNIKIGKDKQFPISQLGDGLQQAIILTYETFIKRQDLEGNEQVHAFFIEEPELHMHAGMVRQLMNFYLNETKHYYFFTTHSNHLLDMADESDQVIIQKFVKELNQSDSSKFDFKIYRCDRDRDLLASLGVKPSSVYLANCTIWVEGITDRLYITKYMEKYLSELKKSNEVLYKKYLRFMPNYHYTFVEYAGSNLVHWDFSDEFTEHLNNQGMNALLTTSSVLLIADGDIQSKGNRVEQLNQTLGKRFVLLQCKETENTLPTNLINMACHIKFSGLNKALESDENLKTRLNNFLSIEGMQTVTKDGFNINLLLEDTNYFHKSNGIGKTIDTKIKVGDPRTADDKPKKCFSDASGTIKEKLKFCRLVLTLMDHVEWELTDSARDLCERIFTHIESSNQ
ncbi:AAA family ATPase [Acinetobacter zhairhuonensis]|uniref:AAA family ATPase n=1 Tax=Acinetobacter sp. A7.4 TaxID=2919921 RepID=UPI001F4EE39A|nr:AAA family ATPase [Acinetobacter sp. A7.4]MCJ8160310.1 AAA family ATPase [Acinetobacter sp. A7.4]